MTTKPAVALSIRFADPSTTPSRYPSGGWFKSDAVMTREDYWTVRGQSWALDALVQAALADNNLNDYGWVQ